MIERLVGAVAALAAAALLVAGAVTSAWWMGHPTVGGASEATIGLRSETVCFTKHEASGKPRCTDVTTTDCDASAVVSCKSRGTTAHSTLFGVCGWGATVLGGLAALLLAIATASAVSKGRAAARGVAIGGAVFGVLGGLAAGGFVVLRPELSGFEGEIGWSAWAYFGGAGAALLTAIVLGREVSEEVAAPREGRPARSAPVSASSPSGRGSGRSSKAGAAVAEFDVGALFAEDEESARPGPPPRPPVAGTGSSSVPGAPVPPAEASLFAPDLPAPRMFSAAQAQVPPAVSLFAPQPPLQSGVRGPAGRTEAAGLERPVFGQSRLTSEVRADTERDLPPDDMQGTPAPEVQPLVFVPPLPGKPAPAPGPGPKSGPNPGSASGPRTAPPTAPPPAGLAPRTAPPTAPPPAGLAPRTAPPTAPPPPRAKAPSLPPPTPGKALPPLPRAKPASLPPPTMAKPAAPPIRSQTDPEPLVVDASLVPRTPTAAATASPEGPVPACPNCDAPTDWNEEHLRFFCRKCRIYL